MKIFKALSKRGLALFLVLTMCLGFFPNTAFAAEAAEPDRKASVTSVRYPSLDRTSAEITYVLPEKYSNACLVCLVDKTGGNPAAAAMANLLGSKESLRKASKADATTIGYDYSAYPVGGLDGSLGTRNSLNGSGGTIGEGQSDELKALKAAVEAVNQSSSDRQLAVLWVPSTNLDERRGETETAEIQAALKELEAAVAQKGGKLVIWQCAETASKLLTNAGTNSETTDIRANVSDFSARMDSWLEAVITDRTKDFTLTFRPTGELAQRITGITSNLGAAKVEGDGKTATVHVGTLYDHQELTVTVKVALDENLYPDTNPK